MNNSLSMDRSSRSRNICLCEDQIRFSTLSDCSVCELWYVTEIRIQCDYQKAVGSKRRWMKGIETNLKEIWLTMWNELVSLKTVNTSELLSKR